jgi:hypothetical protein
MGRKTLRRASTLFIFALLATILPLAGSYLIASPAHPVASFYWPAFLIYALIILAVAGPLVWRMVASRPVPARLGTVGRPFPWWGWGGLALTAVAWVLAWTRFAWFEPLQLYTFTPLWLGYILAINALTVCRNGSCLLLDRPGCFAALFPASAAFWWYFEYLNRYVGNWHYLGVESLSAVEYFIHATISFSTVLPAVISTRGWLASFPRLQAGFTHLRSVRVTDSKTLLWILLSLGAVAFFGIGAWPHTLYSMGWVAPVFVLPALQALNGQPNLLSDLKRGDWRSVGLSALAALMCGFFWELWNWHSLAHWEYAIPLVHRFPIFEMPILGYAGYLPFGIACAAIGDHVCGAKKLDDR